MHCWRTAEAELEVRINGDGGRLDEVAGVGSAGDRLAGRGACGVDTGERERPARAEFGRTHQAAGARHGIAGLGTEHQRRQHAAAAEVDTGEIDGRPAITAGEEQRGAQRGRARLLPDHTDLGT